MPYFVTDFELDTVYTDDRKFQPGERVRDELKREYVFIKYNEGDGADTVVAGYLAVGLDSAYENYEVTCDLDSATIYAVNSLPIGFLQAVLTDGDYGWAQYRGYNRQTVTTDEGVTQGQELMPFATTAGIVDSHDDTAKPTVGIALEADTVAALTAGQVYICISTM